MACCITFTHNDPLIYVDFYSIIFLGCVDVRVNSSFVGCYTRPRSTKEVDADEKCTA